LWAQIKYHLVDYGSWLAVEMESTRGIRVGNLVGGLGDAHSVIKNICLQTTGLLREIQYVLAVSSLASGPLRSFKVLVRLDCPFRQLDAEVTQVYRY
jgi:hypothetical protein